MAEAEYWYRPVGIPNDGLAVTSGTWQGITRTTSPQWTTYHIHSTGVLRNVTWYDEKEPYVDPDLVLQEGL